MAQLLLKTSPKHCDLPIVAAASLGDRHIGQRWPLSCAAHPSRTEFSGSGLRNCSSCFYPSHEFG